MVDSGKCSGGRSNFSHTCTLLSQYLKEKGSFGDLSLGLITPNLADTKGTMNLLPKIDPNSAVDPEESLTMSGSGMKSDMESSGQMTIFYAGQVIVLDDFPADKAKQIITLAGNCSAPPRPAQKQPEAAATTPNVTPTLSPLPALGSDLPIARKNSLARFLEKRKDRITGNAPYKANKPAAKPVKMEPWLELGSQFPFQIQRQH